MPRKKKTKKKMKLADLISCISSRTNLPASTQAWRMTELPSTNPDQSVIVNELYSLAGCHRIANADNPSSPSTLGIPARPDPDVLKSHCGGSEVDLPLSITLNVPVKPDLDALENRCSVSEVDVPLSIIPATTATGEPPNPMLDDSEQYFFVPSNCDENDPLEVDLLSMASRKIAMLLHKSWACLVRNGGINVVMLSRNVELAIQRRLFFTLDGEVTLSVHCQPLTVGDFLGDVKTPGPLTGNTLDAFVEGCVKIVSTMRRFEICTGFEYPEYRHLWSTIPSAKVDLNPYREWRYTETLRSTECTLLVLVRRWRCQKCEELRATVQRRAEAFSKKEPNPTVPNIALSEAQKITS